VKNLLLYINAISKLKHEDKAFVLGYFVHATAAAEKEQPQNQK